MAAGNKKGTIYPHFSIERNKKPNRFFAVPLFGFLIKIIILIPVFIEGFFLSIYSFILWIINAFVILFTGNYWDTAYDFFIGMMNFTTKISAFIYGLTDTYPGFNLTSNGLFRIKIEKPKNPNRLFAIPLFGFLARFILLIPYYIFARVMQNGTGIAMVVSWAPVLFQGRFPESTHEFESDTIRVQQSIYCYMTGLSDRYPSFSISMNHKVIKIILLIVGAIMLLFSNSHYFGQNSNNRVNNDYQGNYNSNY